MSYAYRAVCKIKVIIYLTISYVELLVVDGPLGNGCCPGYQFTFCFPSLWLAALISCSNMCLDGVRKHKISLKNLTNSEKISHSVLFVNGEIGEKCSRNSLSVTLNSEYRENCPVSQINSEFKCLLELRLGVNKLTLNYCDIELSIDLNHVVSDNPKTVTPLYILAKGHDGTFQAKERNSSENACARITLGIRMIQMIFAEKLRAPDGSGRKTFNLSGDCQPFHSNLSMEEACGMPESQLWSLFLALFYAWSSHLSPAKKAFSIAREKPLNPF